MNEHAPADIQASAERFKSNVGQAIIGRSDVVRLIFIALLCEGHVLIEDVPGVGKTLLARATARSLDGSFKRIQCTPDLLPSDVVGIHFFNQKTADFEFRPGPAMANVLLVDEINRAMPRTQSCLLESMQERQITVDRETMMLPRPFLLMATQNPIELEGTFPLPEAQLDRFLLKVKLGYPTSDPPGPPGQASPPSPAARTRSSAPCRCSAAGARTTPCSSATRASARPRWARRTARRAPSPRRPSCGPRR